jgi:hypothetical protein
MLRSVKLHPYKLHKALALDDLPSIALIVGRNNTGKSAILHAAALPKYGVRWDPFLPTAPFESWAAGERESADVTLGFDSSDSVEISFLRQDPFNLQWTVSTKGNAYAGGVRIPLPNQGSGGSGALQGAPPELHRLFFLGAYRAVPTRAFSYQEFSRDIGVSGEGCWNTLHQLKADDDPVFDEIQRVMGTFGLGVGAIRTPTPSAGSGSIRMENFGRPDSLPFLGSGTSSVLPVVTQGALCAKGESLLVEEPELHLHQAAIDALAGFFGQLAKRGVQVVMTTHSTSIFGALKVGIDAGEIPGDAAAIVVNRAANGATSITRHSIDDYHAALNQSAAALRTPP